MLRTPSRPNQARSILRPIANSTPASSKFITTFKMVANFSPIPEPPKQWVFEDDPSEEVELPCLPALSPRQTARSRPSSRPSSRPLKLTLAETPRCARATRSWEAKLAEDERIEKPVVKTAPKTTKEEKELIWARLWAPKKAYTEVKQKKAEKQK